MSYFSKMSEIDIGSIGINKKASANGFENAPEGILTYLAAYGVVVVASAACVVAQLDTPDARLANLAGFWIPLVYFAAAMDFACWYLFQSGILRRILPLPFDIGEIHNRFRYSDIFSGMFFILRCVLALCLGVASGIVVKSVWSGLCVGLYAFALLEILDKFAFAAAVKTHRVFMGFRRVPMVVASLFFFVSALLLALDDRSAKLAVDSISAIFAFNLFPVDAHPLAFLSTACALFIWDAYLYQWEFEFWRRNVKRPELLRTAFPLISAERARRGLTFLGFAKTLDSRFPRISRILASGFARAVGRGWNHPDDEERFFSRSAFLLSDSFGMFSVDRFCLAFCAAAIIPVAARLCLFGPARPDPFFDALVVPCISIPLFSFLMIFKSKPNVASLRVAPIGLLESSLTTMCVFSLLMLLSGILQTLVWVPKIQLNMLILFVADILASEAFAISLLAMFALSTLTSGLPMRKCRLISFFQLIMLFTILLLLVPGAAVVSAWSRSNDIYVSLFQCLAHGALVFSRSMIAWFSGADAFSCLMTLGKPDPHSAAMAFFGYLIPAALLVFALWLLLKHGKRAAKRVRLFQL